MERSKFFDVEISGNLAMFTTPQSKVASERISYPMPTYSSLIGMMERIYYRPGIRWMIDKCRVMNEIDYEPVSFNAVSGSEKINRFTFLYLKGPRYQIRACYTKDNAYYGYPDYHMGHDRRIEKALKCGGTEPVKMGTGNCMAFASPCIWGESEGYYDSAGASEPVHMFYRFEKKKRTNEIIRAGFCMQQMVNGVIDFNGIPVVYRRW